MNTHKLESGTYFICDPCYVLSDKDYNRTILNAPDRNFITNFFMVVQHVQGGDCTLEDSTGKEYGIDSGLFGIISVDLKDSNRNTDNLKKIKCKNPIQIYSDDTEFKIIDTVTKECIFFIELAQEEDNEDFDDDEEIYYDYDENDFESNQDCSEHRPSWY